MTETAKDIPDFFGELAQRAEPSPPSLPAKLIVNSYKIMLHDRVKELQLEGAKKELLKRTAADNSLFSRSDANLTTPVVSGQSAGRPSVIDLFTVNSPVAPAVLNSRAAKTFSSITGRSVVPTNSESHLEDED